MAKTYYDIKNINNDRLLRKRIELLPDFAVEFFRSLNDVTSSNTRIGYTYDLLIFFTYLCEYEKDFENVGIKDFTLVHLSQITADHLENYMDYITLYEKESDGTIQVYHNKEQGKSRKLSSVRTMFNYFYKKRKLESNPAELIDFPKRHEKSITRLEIDEVARLLDEVESGDKLTKRQKDFHAYTKPRDLAIVTLLLGTGIRVSECVGIDIADIDFNVGGIKITRKGGDETIIYFGSEVRQALLTYLEQRKKIEPRQGHENAMFLSLQQKRISTRAVQLLVKKYARLATPLKKISPHKLRSTYGTNLYQESQDIYLVADVLGHKDVNTTRKHYAQMQDSRRKQAAKYVVLRKDDEDETPPE